MKHNPTIVCTYDKDKREVITRRVCPWAMVNSHAQANKQLMLQQQEEIMQKMEHIIFNSSSSVEEIKKKIKGDKN